MSTTDSPQEVQPLPETGEEIVPQTTEQAPQAEHISRLEKELAETKDSWLRARAEMENTRKRAERDAAELRKYAISGFAGEMINVAENLYRALSSIPDEALKDESAVVKNLHAGVEMTRKELLGIFERFGIKRLDPAGEKFDHNYHQAVAQVETADAMPGTVVQVMQAGYTIHDRLLRPAMVAVAKAPGSESKPTVDTVA